MKEKRANEMFPVHKHKLMALSINTCCVNLKALPRILLNMVIRLQTKEYRENEMAKMAYICVT